MSTPSETDSPGPVDGAGPLDDLDAEILARLDALHDDSTGRLRDSPT